MPAFGLLQTLQNIGTFYDSDANSIRLINNFHFSPGFWVAICSLIKYKNISVESFHLEFDENHKQYVSAIGLTRAIWGIDSFQYARINEGLNYSPVAHLNTPEDTNSASATINSCIRNFMSENSHQDFVNELCDVVGDVHDNVWSHGMASGFSMAQKWRVPNSSGSNFYLEFALADCGLGFLGELKRTGRNDSLTDQAAIELCVQEGFSTKKRRPEDDWAQRIPEDVIGNPLVGIEKTVISDNHHMGLGLYKLTSLVRKFSGELWLCSGNSILYIDGNGNNTYIQISQPWQGVVMACRFNSSTLYSKVSGSDAVDQDLERLMDYLGGRNGRS